MIWEIDDQSRALEGVDANGVPDPAYAAALGLMPAPLGRRALAFVIDLGIWIVLQVPLWIAATPLLVMLASGSISPYGFVNHPGFVAAAVVSAISVVLMIVYAVVQWLLHGLKGLTLGKAATGLRTIDVRTLERPGVGAVLLRALIVGASGIVPLGPVILLLSPTYDLERRGRGWHDRWTRVWLVDIRAGLTPYDEKRMRVARKGVKVQAPTERAPLPSLATGVVVGEESEYRPGRRISAGVLGVARAPQAPAAAPSVSRSPAPVVPSPAPLVPVAPAADSTPDAPAPLDVPGPRRTGALASEAGAPDAPGPRRIAAPPLPVPSAATAVRALRLDSGEVIPIDGPTLVGRDPDAAAHAGAHPVRVRDETRSLSKTHALVRPAPGGVEVVDLHSTNGSAVVQGGVEREIPRGVVVLAAAGDTIRLGDRTAEVIGS